MSRFEELKATIKKGVDKGVKVVKSTSRKMLAITHLHNEVRLLQQAREEKMKTIAERTRALVQEGKITLPELTKLVEALTKTEEKIAEIRRKSPRCARLTGI